MFRITKEAVNFEWVRARNKPVVIDVAVIKERVEIETCDGVVVAEPGDYLARGAEGEIYPIGKATFEKNYVIIPPGQHQRMPIMPFTGKLKLGR